MRKKAAPEGRGQSDREEITRNQRTIGFGNEFTLA